MLVNPVAVHLRPKCTLLMRETVSVGIIVSLTYIYSTSRSKLQCFISFPSSSTIFMNDLWLASKQWKSSPFFKVVRHWVDLAVNLDQWLLLIDDHSRVVSLALLVHLSFKEFPWGSQWTSVVPIFWWQIIWCEYPRQVSDNPVLRTNYNISRISGSFNCTAYFFSSSANKDIDDPKLMEQKLWLDAEMEKILDQRKQMELLEKVKIKTGNNGFIAHQVNL